MKEILIRIIKYINSEKKWLLPLLFGIVLLLAGTGIFLGVLIENSKSAAKYEELADASRAEEFPMLHAEPIAGNASPLGKQETSEENGSNSPDDGNGNAVSDACTDHADDRDYSSGKTKRELEEELYELTGVELSELVEEYPETVGWIYFEDDDLSYPIMQAEDNEKYLVKAYDGSSSKAGAIFLDCESTPDLSDPHSLIYGHNMADTTMFGKLHRYFNDESYYENHRFFRIYTGDDCFRYEIFAFGEVEDSSIVFWTFGPLERIPEELMTKIGEFSKTDHLMPEEDDHIVTLSTCTALGSMRVIVCAVRIPWNTQGN